jgi:alpha-tubulin suppressor-like RCC1 family protein
MTAMCWGYNGTGLLGRGTTDSNDHPTQTAVCTDDACGGTLTNVVQVAMGDSFACGLRSDGTVRCWGQNTQGEFGDGTGTDSASAKTGPILPAAATAITAGATSACVILADRSLRCWGSNYYGQVGTGGGMISYSTPQNVSW